MRDAQDIMSSTASNYDVLRLFLGATLAFLVCVLSLFALPSWRFMSPGGSYYFLTLTLYTVLMFASSYVEEEHNFWYWITSGWFFHLFLNSMRKEQVTAWVFHPALMVLVIHRVIRRWNQTGQKFSGAEDIVTSGIFHGNNSTFLWAVIGATYLDVTKRISKHIARSVLKLNNNIYSRPQDSRPSDRHRILGTIVALPLCSTAFVFKLAFTAKDAPELTYGITYSLMAWVETLNLIGLARVVFGGLALNFAWILFAERPWPIRRTQRHVKGHGGSLLQSFWSYGKADGDIDLAVAFFDLTTLFLLTQTKAQNIPVYLLFRFQFFFLGKPHSLAR